MTHTTMHRFQQCVCVVRHRPLWKFTRYFNLVMYQNQLMQGHSDTSVHLALRASCTDWSSWPPCLVCHNTPYIMLNTLRPRQNGRHFPDNIFKLIYLNESIWISIEISLKFVPKGPVNNIPALVQIMAWRRPGDKPKSEPMLVCWLSHICVTRPQWVKSL